MCIIALYFLLDNNRLNKLMLLLILKLLKNEVTYFCCISVDCCSVWYKK